MPVVAAFWPKQVTSSFDPSAVAIIAALTTPPTPMRAAMINAAIVGLKNSGIWAITDRVFFLAAANQQASLIDWKTAANPMMKTGSSANPSFVADTGWTSNANSYLDTGFNPSTAGGSFAQNSASFVVGSATDIAEASNSYAIAGNTTTKITTRRATDGLFNAVPNASLSVNYGATVNGKGLFGWTRTVSSAAIGYRNGGAGVSHSSTSTALTNATIKALTADGSLLSADTLSFLYIGGPLTAAQQAALWAIYSAWRGGQGATP